MPERSGRDSQGCRDVFLVDTTVYLCLDIHPVLPGEHP